MYKTILLALTWLVFFEGKTGPSKVQLQTLDESLRCSLPAPKNIQSTLSGSTEVFFVWDPVPGAAYFRVKVFKIPGNTMIYSRLVTALPLNNGVVINDLEPGTSFNLEVHSVCSNGIESARN